LKAKAIERAAIVVWRDLQGMSFKEIREKLDDDYNWSLGRGTIEKFYYNARPKVYGAFNGLPGMRDDDTPAEQDREDGKKTGAKV
jgi:hypothetical protein